MRYLNRDMPSSWRLGTETTGAEFLGNQTWKGAQMPQLSPIGLQISFEVNAPPFATSATDH